MNTTLQIRLDQKTKEKARKAFSAAGLDMSTGMKIYLTHVANTGKMPFEMFTYNNIPEPEKKKIMRELNRELVKIRGGKAKLYDNVEKMHREILGK